MCLLCAGDILLCAGDILQCAGDILPWAGDILLTDGIKTGKSRVKGSHWGSPP